MADKNETIDLQKGDVICSFGEDIEKIYMIIRGKVSAYASYGVFTLSPGSIVCLTDSYYGISVFNYVAEEETVLLPVSIEGISDVSTICNIYKSQLSILCNNECKYIMELIRNYLTLIVKARKKDPNFTLDNRINKWELDKYNSISNLPSEIFNSYYASSPAIAVSFLIETAHFAIKINDASLELAEFLGINLEQFLKVSKKCTKLQKKNFFW